METGSAVVIFIFLIGICYIIYDSHHYTLLFKVELVQAKHILLDNT